MKDYWGLDIFKVLKVLFYKFFVNYKRKKIYFYNGEIRFVII